MDGLDFATEQTGFNIFSKMVDLISLDDTRGVEKLCNQILEQLDSIEQKMDLLGADLDHRIAQLETYLKTYNWSDNASKLAAYQSKYNAVYDEYQNYLSAAKDYANTPESDVQARQKYLDEMDFYKNKFAQAAGALDFNGDIRDNGASFV